MASNTRRYLAAPVAAAAILALTACTSDSATDDGPTPPSSAGSDADDTVGNSGSAPSDSGAAQPGQDLKLLALTALATAEGHVGGAAYEIDDQDDDGTWEVDVRDGDSSVEVTVSADGTTVNGTENDDLDGEDQAGLDAASITLIDAIELVGKQVDGEFDDAELESEDGVHYWEITWDTEDQDDLEINVSVTGEIIDVATD